ncbi:hypothetical protein [Allokutzneria sp. NRRL B-24872]|uniref:CdiA C-terminal domain-containing protein n=1 Tax=Allokutzneria sp. NRRL B-24872 TaxID=1137961 RepID=UPI0011779657|nr:hypothetical protein [Allokutzneria sp. NRRL B-24872]
MAARLRGIAALLPVSRLQRAAAAASAASRHLLLAHQGSRDAALAASASTLHEAASTATASAIRLRKAAAWIESYCADVLGVAAPTAVPFVHPAESSSRTKPSGPRNPTAKPGGFPARISPHDDAITVRSLARENESATILARHGYQVEQRPQVPGPKRPDYRVEGRIFDNYAPTTAKARNIAKEMATKVKKGQAARIVLNLHDSTVDLATMKTQLTEWPIPGLHEVVVIDKNDSVIDFFP